MTRVLEQLDDPRQGSRGARSVKSAERVLDLLEHIGEQRDGVTFSTLARQLAIPKSSLHALLDVLTGRGYLEFRADSRTYSLGLRSWETGQAYQRHHDIIREAHAVLDWVVRQVNETAQLARIVNAENVYLAKVDSTHPLRLQSEVGRRLSAHATGVGKALLAQLGNAEVIDRFGAGALPAYTANTIATTDALIEELELIRQRGFAIDNEEYTPGVFCIAVPVFEGSGKASVAVSVSVPTTRAQPEQLATILSVIAAASLQLSERCGVATSAPSLTALASPKQARKAIDTLIGSGRYALPFAS